MSQHVGDGALSPFVLRQRQAINALRGLEAAAWIGVEMAVRDDPTGTPQFADPDVKCLQFFTLDLRTPAGQTVRWSTYQNDDLWGLQLTADSFDPDLSRVSDGYRRREVRELPVGPIGAVELFADAESGDVLEVHLTVGQTPLLLMAAELYEEWDGSITYVRGDESVLVFTDPVAANAVQWRPPRAPTALRRIE